MKIKHGHYCTCRSLWPLWNSNLIIFACLLLWSGAARLSVDTVQSTLCQPCVLLDFSSYQLVRYLAVDQTLFNSLWSSDAIWWHRSGSTLAQVMACYLTAPSHYLNQCWHIISNVQWHSPKAISQEIPQPSITKIYLKIISTKFQSNLSGFNELNGMKKYQHPTQSSGLIMSHVSINSSRFSLGVLYGYKQKAHVELRQFVCRGQCVQIYVNVLSGFLEKILDKQIKWATACLAFKP